jgi:glycosyltransferase involved in cell wall biosynthesis
MEAVVSNERTGLQFALGDADDLAATMDWAWTHPEGMQEMGRYARAEYETKYTAVRNFQVLLGIYEKAIARLRSATTSKMRYE